MRIKNLTPHSIRIGNQLIKQDEFIPPIRIEQQEHLIYAVDDIPVKMLLHNPKTEYELPPPEPNTIYIVSRLVADIFKNEREDFVFPYDFIRTKTGQLIGCKSLARFEPCA